MVNAKLIYFVSTVIADSYKYLLIVLNVDKTTVISRSMNSNKLGTYDVDDHDI